MTSGDPFGGKIVVLVGDFRQCGPVIPRGTRADIVEASLISSHLWPLFTIRNLTIPIRNAQDPEFADFVDSIGDGLGPEVFLPMIQTVYTEADLISFVWPEEFVRNLITAGSRCIIAVRNDQVNRFNSVVIGRLEGDEKRYFASDTISEANDLSGDEELHDAGSSLLDYYAANNILGLPLFDLRLKVGALCRIMRNISVKEGLVKNTRVVVTDIGNHIITVKKIIMRDGANVIGSTAILLPRIKFIHVLRSGHTLERKQFPIALAYASTFNSCQGLTLDAVGCDLTVPAFSHGQLYVALSRIRRREDACILMKDANRVTYNVTYTELLSGSR